MPKIYIGPKKSKYLSKKKKPDLWLEKTYYVYSRIGTLIPFIVSPLHLLILSPVILLLLKIFLKGFFWNGIHLYYCVLHYLFSQNKILSLVSWILGSTWSPQEPNLESKEVGEWQEFHVLLRKYGWGVMNELEHCCDATVKFSPSRRLVLCIKLHPEVNEELVDSTFLLLFALPVTRFFFSFSTAATFWAVCSIPKCWSLSIDIWSFLISRTIPIPIVLAMGMHLLNLMNSIDLIITALLTKYEISLLNLFGQFDRNEKFYKHF